MTTQALARALETYRNRDKRARELRMQGKRIVGYFCCYPPVELMTALDLVPFRIGGDINEPVEKANSYMETNMCPFVRSCFELALKGRYDFLDGIVIPHSCDAIERSYDIWRYYHKSALIYFLNVPHMVHEGSYPFFYQELLRLKQALEALADKKLQTENLVAAIQLHNENRALLRDFYRLRLSEPPLLSGGEAVRIALAATALPPTECNRMLREIISEVKAKGNPSVSRTRVFLYGSHLDDATFVDLIEGCSANVVMDDLCTTARWFWWDVQQGGDPIYDLCRHYLDNVMCPRTLRQGKNHTSGLRSRFGHLSNYASEFKASCVLAYTMRLCDTFEFDLPDLEDYLRQQGLPFLNLEIEYNLSSLGQLRTRIEAFLESAIGAKGS